MATPAELWTGINDLLDLIDTTDDQTTLNQVAEACANVRNLCLNKASLPALELTARTPPA